MKSTLRPWAVLGLSLLLAACPDDSSSSRASVTWSRSFGGPNFDEAAAAIPTSDGGYLFAGTTGALYDTREVDDYDQLDGELWVCRLNGSGNRDWERTYGEPFLSPAGNRVRYTHAVDAGGGETWLAGVESASDMPTGDPLADGGNLVVARLDAAGNVLFRRVFDSGDFLGFPFSSALESTHESVRALAATEDGGLLVACWLSARVDKPDEMRFGVEVNAPWIVKLEDDGDLVWDVQLFQNADGIRRDRFFPYHAGATIHMDLCAAEGGGGLLAAYSSAEPDTELVRVQSNGTILWSKVRVDGHVRDCAAIDSDDATGDGFVLAGIDEPFDGKDGFVVRLDPNGDPAWQRVDGQVRGFDCVVQGEYIDPDGLQVDAVGAAGVRDTGTDRVGRILFVSLDGSNDSAFDPFIVYETPEIAYDSDRWRVLARDSQLTFISSFDRFQNLLGSETLSREPAETAQLLPDGSVVDLQLYFDPARVVLTRLAPTGNVTLERDFPGTGRFIERAHALVELRNRPGYAVLAESSSFGTGFDEIWLLLLDEEGEIDRQRLVENGYLESPYPVERLNALAATDDGGVAFAAVVEAHSRVVRFDAAGEELWNSDPVAPERSSGFLGLSLERTTGLITTADGGFVVVGSVGLQGAWATRLDADGEVVWRNEYEAASNRPLEITAVIETTRGFALGGVHDTEPFVLEIDDAGAVQRAAFFPLGGAAAGPITRLALDDREGLVLATSWIDSDEPLDEIGDGAASTGRVNVLLLSLDEDLQPSWYRVYGALYDEHLADLRAVPEGGWILAARSDSLGDRGEAWLLRVDYEGLITESCNAYLAGGEWPGAAVPITVVQSAFTPDVAPENLAPAELSLLDTEARPQFPPAAVVARQCVGFTPAGRSEEPPPGADSYTLTLEFEGGGSGRVFSFPAGLDCRATCSAVFPAGTEVALTPIRDEGSFFSHWDGCDQDFGEEGCLVQMDGDRTVTVYFE